ncbi:MULTISPECIES: DnaT-like ssDNA-binding domain-containing protein [unclassified Anaerobiospirillum]|uniref:DnaT-like ssDNA-binding domain-containing protein n=1 Tax=unclassified Anaerobiospirillum TaxID=2647410 RepID=UPI001FF24F99|nr:MULTISPECIES: DnaT-like ssDNA-binding domain-containing protein [unclassified Anaerobiospirillum]MCK0535595.1 DnaT-like ssDNA-binding domain-containing protein [Anaerobiospirillum sp. NML120511]MCK0540738.1 DnaT-like ssDNA-binding domain-containing protein [Anaerobiospirillum sp. NML02-A-032]
MLNRAEFIQLQSTVLSHLARTMYVFYIKPQARQGNTFIDPVALASQLVSTSTSAPCSPSLEDIEAALNELEMLSLIEREQEDAVWQNASVTLPFFLEETKIVPGMPFTMFLAWEPSASLREVALNMGLADFSYQESELRDFISFWINNRMRRSQHGWETAFIRRLMKNRASDATRTYAASVTRAQTGSSRSRMQKRLDSISTDPLQRAHFPDANSSDPRAAVMAMPPGSAIAGQTVLPQGTGVQPITSYNPQLSEPAPGNQAAALAAVSSAASGHDASGHGAAVPATAGHVGAGNAAYSHAGQLPPQPFGKPGFGQQDGYGQSPYSNKTQGQTAPAYGMSAHGMPPHAAASQNMQPYGRTAQVMEEGRFARQGRPDAPGAYASGSYQGLQTAVGANRTAVSSASYGAGAASAQGNTDNMRHGQNQYSDYRRNNGSSWQKAPVHPDFIEHNNNDSQNRSWRDREKDAYGSEPVWDDRQLGYESGYQASQPLPPRRDAAQRTAARAGIMQSSNSPDSEAYSPGVYAVPGVTGDQSPYYDQSGQSGQNGQPGYGTSGPQGAAGGPYQHHMPYQQAQDQGRYYKQAQGQGHGQTTGQLPGNGPGQLPGTRQGYVQANGHNGQPYEQNCQGPQYSPDIQAMYSRQCKDELYGNNSRSYQGAYQSQRYTSPHGDHGMAAQGQQMQNGAHPGQYQNGSMSNGSPYGQPQPQPQYSPYGSSQGRSQAAGMTDTAVTCSNTAGNSLVYSASASASPDETGSMSQPYALQNGQYSTNEKAPWAQSDESNAFNSTAQSSRSMGMRAHGGMMTDASVSGYAAAAAAGAAAAGRGDDEDSEERKKAERAEQKERRWLEKRNKTNYSALALEQARNQINDAAAAASAITSAAGAGAAADTSCGNAAASESDKGDSQLTDGSAPPVAGPASAAGATGASCAAGAADSSQGSSCPGTKKSWHPEGSADTQLARPRALRKPTLRSIASGKPEYELIAPGYSDPLNAGPFDEGFNGDDLNVSGTQTFSQAQGMGQGFTGSARTGNLEGAQLPANPFASFGITPSATNTMATADTAAPAWQHTAPATNGAHGAGAAPAADAVNMAGGLSPAATYIPDGSADMSALADVSAMQPELYSPDALNNGEPAPEILPGFNPDDASGGLIMAAPQTFEQVMLMQERQLADQNDLSAGGFDQSFMEELNREFNQVPQARLAAMEPEQLNQLHADSTTPSAPTTVTAADASAVPDSISAPDDFPAAVPPDCTAAAAAATAATEAAANADAGHDEVADGATQAAVESGSDVRDECEAAADSAAAEAAAADCAATEAAVDGDVPDEACGAVEAAVDGYVPAEAGAATAVYGDVPDEACGAVEAAVDGDARADAGAAAETDRESGSGWDSLS